MNSNFIDVHTFDGKWNHNIQTRFTREQKYKLFGWLVCGLSRIGVDRNTINGIKLIIDNIQLPGNYDNRNNVYADDILAEICSILIDKREQENGDVLLVDTLKNIAEQIKDMYLLGQCPQGRSTRLIQIYNYL